MSLLRQDRKAGRALLLGMRTSDWGICHTGDSCSGRAGTARSSGNRFGRLESGAAAGRSQKKGEVMMNPETYAEWCDILDGLRDGRADEETLSIMRKGTLHWQAGVADRFTRRLTDVVNTRMNRAIDRYQRGIQHRGDEQELTGALLALRHELEFLRNVMDIPAIPADLRKQYVALVEDQAKKIQESLLDSAKTERTGKLQSILRNHPVTLQERQERGENA